MEINVTKFVKRADAALYSNSIAKSGLNNIGQITWNKAKTSKYSFVTEENRQVFIDYFDEYGAWDDLEDWPINELNGLFIQELSSQLNELEMFDTYEEFEESDQVQHNIFKTDENEYYFYVGF